MNFADRVKETSAVTDTVTITLTGAQQGFRTFATGLSVGTANIPVCVVDPVTGDWETALYTLTSSTVLTRAYIVSSSNSNLAVAFAAGTKEVFCTPVSSMFAGGLSNPDDVGYDIVLCIGQSNMVGRGTIDALADMVDSRVMQFGGASAQARYRTIFSGASPTHNAESLQTTCSPQSAFGTAYAAIRPSNRKVLLVPCAYGGTSLVHPNFNGFVEPPWASGNPGGTLYENAITQANLAIAAAHAVYPSSRIVGIKFHQGESDADNNIPQATYSPALSAMIAGLRARITGAADSWFIIGGMMPERIASGGAKYIAIDAAHKEVALATNKCAFVAGPSGFAADTYHFNAAGSRLLGVRMALAVPTAEKYIAAPVDATAITMSGPTSGVVSVESTAFTIGVSPVGGVIVGTVVVTPSDDGAGGTFAPTSISFMTGTSTGTFTYTASTDGEKIISVTNNGGLSNPANITYTVAAAATVPDAPTIGIATGGDASASVAFTAPASDGGSVITGHTATSSPGGLTGTGATSPITVSGLTNDVAYTFTVTATNAVGTSASSAASNSVTPAAVVTTYANWNPADKSSTLTLSNGDLTLTGAGTNTSAWCAARSTVSKTAGKWCWEVTLGVGTHIIGVGVAGDTLANFPGFSANGVGYYSNTGAIFRNNANVAGGAAITSVAGDVIGVLYDADAETVGFTKNGVQLSTLAAYAVPAGAIFAMVASRESSTGVFATTTTNFGETAFAYAPPTGYVGLAG